MRLNICHSSKRTVLGAVAAVTLCGLQLSTAYSASVNLAWNANPEINLAGYRLSYGDTSHAYSQQMDVGNVTSATVLDLTPGTPYYFAVKAYNTAGVEGPYSSEVAYTIPLVSPTPTPTPGGTPVNISGSISYCSNPVPVAVPEVTLTLTGSSSGLMVSDGSGNYQFSSLPRGGTYTVTPTKVRLGPGSPGITTVDVVAVQRHFLGLAAIPAGCRLAAADVNDDALVSTADAIAIQRFALGVISGTGNVGKYEFTPTSRTYPVLASNQINQNYSALVFGDVASGFVYRQEQDPSLFQRSGGNVAELTLPQLAVDPSVTNFTAEVITTNINVSDRLVGFQGDFVFDERVVTFESDPVEAAGLTSSEWNVSGNVLPGDGPIRTLRISGYSNDITPLSGSGTLFNLKMITTGNTPGSTTDLIWAVAADEFRFIDADLNTQTPVTAPPGLITIEVTP